MSVKTLNTVADAMIRLGRVTTESVEVLRNIADGDNDGSISKKDTKAIADILSRFDKLAKKGELSFEPGARKVLGLVAEGDSPKGVLLGRVKINSWDSSPDAQRLTLYVDAPMNCPVGYEIVKAQAGDVTIKLGLKSGAKARPGPSKDKEQKLDIKVDDAWFNKFQFDLKLVDAAGNAMNERPITIWSWDDSE